MHNTDYTTSHSTTGKTPTELCYGRTIRSKLPSILDLETSPPDSDFRERDSILKEKGKIYADEKRGAKKNFIQVGDSVLMQNLISGNKLLPTYNTQEFEVVRKSGPRVEIKNKSNGKLYERNATHLKKIPPTQSSLETGKEESLDSQQS